MRQIAVGFLSAHGLQLPVEPDVALHAAGFFLLPCGHGHGPVARDGRILRYDETRPTWALELWDVLCGHVLERVGHPHGFLSRVELARWFGVDLSPCANGGNMSLTLPEPR